MVTPHSHSIYFLQHGATTVSAVTALCRGFPEYVCHANIMRTVLGGCIASAGTLAEPTRLYKSTKARRCTTRGPIGGTEYSRVQLSSHGHLYRDNSNVF